MRLVLVQLNTAAALPSPTRNLLQVPVPKQQHRHQLLLPHCFCQKDYFRYTAICAELSFSSVSVSDAKRIEMDFILWQLQ